MEYIRASEILPADLIETLQLYAEGCIVYIPKRPGTRESWGKYTETKNELAQRNQKIKNDYKSGFNIKHLMDKYHLAESTIKKIIYAK